MISPRRQQKQQQTNPSGNVINWRRIILTVAVLVSFVGTCDAFTTTKTIKIHPTINFLNQQQPRQYHSVTSLAAAAGVRSSGGQAKKGSLAALAVPNLFAKLPWNVKKEKEREQRRIQLERATLHRQLGIAEDATYEEIVTATESLITKAGTNMKEKVKIEIAKDKILQIRLNERLAGLALNQEARAMSNYEIDGADEDEIVKKKDDKGWAPPAWTQGLIVKPDEKHLKSQLQLWGIITGIGLALPPAQDYLGRFTWLVCVAQLTFRGMPQEMREGGGMGMSFNMGGGAGKGGHRKIAFALGFTTWIIGAIMAYGMMPAWARGQRWTASVAFTLQNLIFGLVSSYLQPYKG